MIYKNDVKYTLTKEELLKYGKPMTFILPPNVKKWDPLNKRFNCPKRTCIEPFYTVYDPATSETVMIRYVTTLQRKGKDEVDYLPDLIEIDHSGIIKTTSKDADLNYLMSVHPQNLSNPHRDQDKAMIFMTEDKGKIAKEKADKERSLSDANDYIFRLATIAKLKEMAKVLEMQNVEDMEDDEVRIELQIIAKKHPVFFMSKLNDASNATMALIQDALDAKIIKFNEEDQKWEYVTVAPGKESKIMVVPAGQEKTMTFARYLNHIDKHSNKENISELLEAIPKKKSNKFVKAD